MSESEDTEFFAKLWKCPIRRFLRYGRKLVFVVILGVFIWMSLDFLAIFISQPTNYPPFLSLIIHALLTIFLSFVLTLGTQKLYLRLNSRFRLIRAFLPPKEPSMKQEHISKKRLKSIPHTKLHVLIRILYYTSLIGFISGATLGYLYLQGWVPDTEQSMLIYALTLGIAGILCTSFVLYQVKQNRLKAEVVNINKRKK
jgi:hypothetical protein